jgi:hypothetical protein
MHARKEGGWVVMHVVVMSLWLVTGSAALTTT